MSDYISRVKVKFWLDENLPFYYTTKARIKTLIKFDDEIPSADVRENIHGKWTEWKGRDGRYTGIPICSNCNTGFSIIAKEYNFCPNCGADMR